jgi:carbamoyl-phosphate synthase large subunit
MIKNGQIDLIINTPMGKESKYDDSYIRRMAIQHKIPYITTLAAAKASIEGIKAAQKGKVSPKALQDYYKDLQEKEITCA